MLPATGGQITLEDYNAQFAEQANPEFEDVLAQPKQGLKQGQAEDYAAQVFREARKAVRWALYRMATQAEASCDAGSLRRASRSHVIYSTGFTVSDTMLSNRNGRCKLERTSDAVFIRTQQH